MKTGVIKEFRGEHFFLSNYYTAPFLWRNHQFHSGEQAFAFAKSFFATHDRMTNLYQSSVMDTKAPGEAKKIGRGMEINVPEWDKHKVQYMREIVHAKFAGVQGLAGQLINTGACMLVEGNDWGDKFWGRCLDKSTGKMVGLNTLGTLLMEERGYWLYSDFNDKREK